MINNSGQINKIQTSHASQIKGSLLDMSQL